MGTRLRTIAIGTLAAFNVTAAAASADSLIAPAPGARNVTQGGDWLAWAAPSADRWRIFTRSPSGAIRRPAIRSFDAAPDLSIGSNQFAISGRRVLAVYARCADTTALTRCDLYSLDLAAGRERKLTRASSSACSETAASIFAGSVGFVRRGRGCPRPGVYRQVGARRAQRIVPTIALETGINASRIAYSYRSAAGFGLAVRRISGEGEPVVLLSASDDQPRSLIYGRYTAAWMLPAGGRQAVFMSSRISGTRLRGTPLRQGNRLLPASTDSIAGEDGRPTRYLDADGIKSMAPPLF